MIYRDQELLRCPGVRGKPIEGVAIKPLHKIPDERGAIYHMLRSDDEIFQQFGEIYFSLIHPQVIKGWHWHEKMVLHYAVIDGKIKLVLFDDRLESKTRGNLIEIFAGEENYCLIQVPAQVWNGFKGLGTKTSIVANCASIPHDPLEIKRWDPFTAKIPYDWNLKHG